MTDVNRSIKEIGLNARLLAFCEREGVKTVGDFLSRSEELETMSPKAAEKIMEAINVIEDNERTIVYIDVDKIKPHPDNPRKDVGDVSELAESIKQNGIMQNLTVIPSDTSLDEYITLIGHRRLAAAKLAGLDKVPCAVVGNLSRSEQVSIMLAENMQRADLTLYEQAEGLQMMLDLGDTVSTITKKTGMSETTVRRRLSLMQYDREAVKASIERGASIADYDEIKKIKDKDKQDKLINSIGTNNFKWELQRALDDQARVEKYDKLVEFVSSYAKELPADADKTKLKTVKNYYSGYDDPQLPNGYDASLNYYYVRGYNFVVVYSDYTSAERDEAERRIEAAKQREAKDAELKERRRKLDEIRAAMLKSRVDFIRDFKCLSQDKSIDKLCIIYDINSLVTECISSTYSTNIDWEDIITALYPEAGDEPAEHIGEYIAKMEQDKLIIINLLASAGFFDDIDAHNWFCVHNKNPNLECIYKILDMLGYKMSESEREYISGTHEAFVKEDKAND